MRSEIIWALALMAAAVGGGLLARGVSLKGLYAGLFAPVILVPLWASTTLAAAVIFGTVFYHILPWFGLSVSGEIDRLAITCGLLVTAAAYAMYAVSERTFRRGAPPSGGDEGGDSKRKIADPPILRAAGGGGGRR